MYCTCYGTQSNLMAGGLSSKTKGLGLSPKWDFVLLVNKTLPFHSALLHVVVYLVSGQGLGNQKKKNV